MPRVRRRNLGNQAFAEFVPIVKTSFAEPNGHSEDATFSWFVENRFPVAPRNSRRPVRVGRDTLDQIRHLNYPFALPAFATPIIESRVTSAASSASLIPSVSGGRSGRTR
jgi:hypothetical protein